VGARILLASKLGGARTGSESLRRDKNIGKSIVFGISTHIAIAINYSLEARVSE
jgi:hypothetical protein